MRLPVFGFSHNPQVDQPILRKSVAYCEKQMADGTAQGVFESGRLVGIQMLPPEARPAPDDSTVPHIETKPTITFKESSANAEYKAGAKNRGSVIRAHKKFILWPRIGDTKAIRVGIRG